MKNKILTVVLIMFFAAGLLIFNYPVISTLYNQLHQGTVMATYDKNLARLKEEELERYYEEAKDYNEKLAQTGEQLRDAFSQEGKEDDEEYLRVLDMEESGVMGSVEIPDINLYLPVYHGTASDVLKTGIGHLEGSSIPVGGADTHSILTGHRGLPQAELFTNLDQIENGDIFYIHILQKTLAYKVYNIEVIEPENTEHLVIEKGRDLLTLLTCTPYGINSHRLLIHGERTEYTEDETVTGSVSRKENLWHWLVAQKAFLISAGMVILAIAYGIFRLIRRCMKKCRSKKEEADL